MGSLTRTAHSMGSRHLHGNQVGIFPSARNSQGVKGVLRAEVTFWGGNLLIGKDYVSLLREGQNIVSEIWKSGPNAI